MGQVRQSTNPHLSKLFAIEGQPAWIVRIVIKSLLLLRLRRLSWKADKVDLNIPWRKQWVLPPLVNWKKALTQSLRLELLFQMKTDSHGVIAHCKLPTFWCLCFQCWSRPNFPTLCDQLHYHSEVYSEMKILYYRTPNIKVTLLLNYLRPYENNPNAWDELTPY